MILRPKYLDQLIQAIDTDFVKLLVGVRRCGKSTLLRMLQTHLSNQGIPKDRIIDINFEMIEYDKLKDKDQLHEFIQSRVVGSDRHYLFIDEVQELPEWARIINSLKVSFPLDIYVTGSNARVFAGEHLTYLAGRTLTIHVFPLSYREMIDFLQLRSEFKNHYNTFLESSFPAIVLEQRSAIKTIMKQDLFEAIFQRDIVLRGKIQNEGLFFRVARFVLEHVGSTISVNKIANTLNSTGTKISYDTVDHYLNLMVKSYFLVPCVRFDINGKEILKTNGKYYVIDFGIRQKLVPNYYANTGKILENFIFLELIKSGYEVFVGKVGRDYEIDFIATKGNRKMVVQVSESVIDPTTREREIRPFDFINDSSERFLVTFDTIRFESDQYRHYNVFDFLEIL
jgi:uncharacterized protein